MNIRPHGFGLRNPIYLLYLKYLFKEVLASSLIRLFSSFLIMLSAILMVDNFISSGKSGAAEVFRLGVILVVLTMSGYFGLQSQMRMALKPLLAPLPFKSRYWMLLDSAGMGALILLIMGPFVIYLYVAKQLFYLACWPLLLSLPFVIACLYFIQNHTERQSVFLTISLGILWGIIVFSLS